MPSVALIWVLITSGIFLVSVLVSQTCQYLVNHTDLLVPYRQRDEFPSDAESYDIPVANGTDHMSGITLTPEKEPPFSMEEIVEIVTYQIRAANGTGGNLPYSLDDKRRNFAAHGKDSGFSETEDMESIATVSSDGNSQPSPLVLETLPIPDSVMNPPGSPGQSSGCLCTVWTCLQHNSTEGFGEADIYFRTNYNGRRGAIAVYRRVTYPAPFTASSSLILLSYASFSSKMQSNPSTPPSIGVVNMTTAGPGNITTTEPTAEDVWIRNEGWPPTALVMCGVFIGVFVLSTAVSKGCQYIVNHTNLIIPNPIESPVSPRRTAAGDSKEFLGSVRQNPASRLPGKPLLVGTTPHYDVMDVLSMLYSLDANRHHSAVDGKSVQTTRSPVEHESRTKNTTRDRPIDPGQGESGLSDGEVSESHDIKESCSSTMHMQEFPRCPEVVVHSPRDSNV
ncbi:Hypp3270 [Branchiostoma lanceolatum]|uniref:Hypp3270 protein n=1 Tax=Branchiostoma lanceolatum TaxID=7740 RepID=A0A8J9ZYL7_BRALA|nr:Hypp3270 [Branchiostoma lanceolatum]